MIDTVVDQTIESPGKCPRMQRRWDHDQEIRTLRQLWARQQAEDSVSGVLGTDLSYVAAHFAMDLTLRRRLRVLDQISEHLHGSVLEWGCQHALDSCVFRSRFGDQLDLHGCDLYTPGAYHVFHEAAGFEYKQLTHPVFLPYPNQYFDVIVSNGVLEHVDDDKSSLYEIVRVLKPGGTLVITCLPNRWSYTEAIQRWLGHNAHDRLYEIGKMISTLKARGFIIGGAGYSFLLPTMLYGFPRFAKRLFATLDRPLRWLNALLEQIWPVNRLASNLWIVAHKPR